VSPRLNQEWRGPHATKDAAVAEAGRVADRKQKAVVVYEITDARYANAYGDEPQVAAGLAVFTAVPNPEAAPSHAWPIVTVYVSSDVAVRDLHVANWREMSARQALKAGVTGALRPYKVSAGQKPLRVGGLSVTVYLAVVRKNPTFPHHKLATADQHTAP
jgi:hypothetical protein